MKFGIIGAGFACVAAAATLGCSVDATDIETVELTQALHQENGNHWGNQDFVIESPDFEAGGPLPTSATCEGKPFAEGESPQLNWTKGPEGTKSFAILFRDDTLVEFSKTFEDPEDEIKFANFGHHWAMWNIPHEVHELPAYLEHEQFPASMKGAEQLSAWGPEPHRYFGPCPSWPTFCFGAPVGTDTYSFTIYALDSHEVTLPEDDGSSRSYVLQLGNFFDEIAISSAVVHATSDAVPNSFEAQCPVNAGEEE